MGETGKYCRNCSYIESVDDIEYFWCKMHKKTFSLSAGSIVKQLRKEIVLLKIKRKELEDINLEMIEVEYNHTNGKYTKIMLAHLPDFSKQNQHSSIYICENCNLALNKIIEDKISEQMDDIIENVRNEIEDEDNEEEE